MFIGMETWKTSLSYAPYAPKIYYFTMEILMRREKHKCEDQPGRFTAQQEAPVLERTE